MKSTKKSVIMAEACPGKRVRLVRVIEGEGLSIEGHELSLRIGREGMCDAMSFDGVLGEPVNVIFDDGQMLSCLLSELEICHYQSVPRTSTEWAEPRFVRSCIAHVGFPDSVAGFVRILEGEAETDMERAIEKRWPLGFTNS